MANVEFNVRLGSSLASLNQLVSAVRRLRRELERAAEASGRLRANLSGLGGWAPGGFGGGPAGPTPPPGGFGGAPGGFGGLVVVPSGGPQASQATLNALQQLMLNRQLSLGPAAAGNLALPSPGGAVGRPAAPWVQTLGVSSNAPGGPGGPGGLGGPAGPAGLLGPPGGPAPPSPAGPGMFANFFRALPTVGAFMAMFTAIRETGAVFRSLTEDLQTFGRVLIDQERSFIDLSRNLAATPAGLAAGPRFAGMGQELRLSQTMVNALATSVFSASGGNVRATEELLRAGAPIIRAEAPEVAATYLGAAQDIRAIAPGELSAERALGLLQYTQSLSRVVDPRAMSRFARMARGGVSLGQRAGRDPLTSLQDMSQIFATLTTQTADPEARQAATNILRVFQQLQPGANASSLAYAPGVYNQAPIEQLQAVMNNPTYRQIARQEITAEAQFLPALQEMFGDIETDLVKALRDYKPSTNFEDSVKDVVKKITDTIETALPVLMGDRARNIQVLTEGMANATPFRSLPLDAEQTEKFRASLAKAYDVSAGTTDLYSRASLRFRFFLQNQFAGGIDPSDENRYTQEALNEVRFQQKIWEASGIPDDTVADMVTGQTYGQRRGELAAVAKVLEATLEENKRQTAAAEKAANRPASVINGETE